MSDLVVYVVLTPLTLRMAWLFFHAEIERNLGSVLCDFLSGIIMPEAEMCYSVSHTWGPQVFLMNVFLMFSILKPTAFLFLPLLLCYFHHDLRDPIPTWLSLFTIECLEQMLSLSLLWLSFPEVGDLIYGFLMPLAWLPSSVWHCYVASYVFIDLVPYLKQWISDQKRICALVPFPVAMIKHLDQSNLKENGFVLAHRSNCSLSWWGSQSSRSLKMLNT